MKRQKSLRILTLITIMALLFSIVTACSNQDNSDVSNKQSNIESDDRVEEKDEDKSDAEAGSVVYPIEYEDSVGRVVKIEKQPEKIVSLAPSSTEILFALGLGDRVVGTTSYCDYPEEANSTEKVGDYSEVNVEKIVSLESDIVFASTVIEEDIVKKLDDAGVAVVVIEGTDFESVYNSIIDIGMITGRQDEAKKLTDDMKAKVDEIKDKVKGIEKKDCYFVLGYGEGGNWTSGPGSFIHEMMEMAGGNNIAADGDSPWVEYSMEKLIEKDPEVLIISSMAGDVEEIKETEGYKELQAIKKDNLKVIDANIVSRPGPRLSEALEEVAKALHPDLFE